VFICPKCKAKRSLSLCACGYIIPHKDDIWQLSDMPDIVIDGEGDKYIGYEYIGDGYSGNHKYSIDERDVVFSKEIVQQTGNGVFLDLACGDGCFTVPCASFGIKIIAGDISNKMLSILKQKASYNNILLCNVILCRMNALEVPLFDESVDTVVANSVLHLISRPEKVISEICRVLKCGGSFICKDDKPGKNTDNSSDNHEYLEIVNSIYSTYWSKLNQYNVFPTKYSWKFDRSAICDRIFREKTEKLIKRGNIYEIPLKYGFLPRIMCRGFSDQAGVPKDLHDKVINEILNEIKLKYGNNFANKSFKGIEEDLLITIYRK
jgi:ubiquinone/menaquinone biosynthesis C-methylase UbiE